MDVLHFLQSKDNHSLPLMELSQKIAVQLALAMASRASDFNLLDLIFMETFDEYVCFRIPKTRRSGPPREVTIYRFTGDQSLCPVICLQVYLTKTVSMREEDQSNDTPHPLFLSVKKSHSPVSVPTIARWIKPILQKSGVDTSIFTAHSTRAASTSAAKSLQVK